MAAFGGSSSGEDAVVRSRCLESRESGGRVLSRTAASALTLVAQSSRQRLPHIQRPQQQRPSQQAIRLSVCPVIPRQGRPVCCSVPRVPLSRTSSLLFHS